MITYFIRKLINGCHVWVKVTTTIEKWKSIPRAVGITILCSGIPQSSYVNMPPVPIVSIPAIKQPIKIDSDWKPSEIWNFPPREEYIYIPNIPSQKYWIDKPISVVEIPEPITFGIFVIGCLLILLVKRRK